MNEIILIIWIHFFADFLLQNDKMALNKSSSNKWLFIHCLVYSIPLCIINWRWALVNGIFHLFVDWLTSRGTSYLWKKEKRHWFFCLIGFDQYLHLTILIYTLRWFQ